MWNSLNLAILIFMAGTAGTFFSMFHSLTN